MKLERKASCLPDFGNISQISDEDQLHKGINIISNTQIIPPTKITTNKENNVEADIETAHTSVGNPILEIPITKISLNTYTEQIFFKTAEVSAT